MVRSLVGSVATLQSCRERHPKTLTHASSDIYPGTGCLKMNKCDVCQLPVSGEVQRHLVHISLMIGRSGD